MRTLSSIALLFLFTFNSSAAERPEWFKDLPQRLQSYVRDYDDLQKIRDAAEKDHSLSAEDQKQLNVALDNVYQKAKTYADKVFHGGVDSEKAKEAKKELDDQAATLSKLDTDKFGPFLVSHYIKLEQEQIVELLRLNKDGEPNDKQKYDSDEIQHSYLYMQNSLETTLIKQAPHLENTYKAATNMAIELDEGHLQKIRYMLRQIQEKSKESSSSYCPGTNPDLQRIWDKTKET